MSRVGVRDLGPVSHFRGRHAEEDGDEDDDDDGEDDEADGQLAEAPVQGLNGR